MISSRQRGAIGSSVVLAIVAAVWFFWFAGPAKDDQKAKTASSAASSSGSIPKIASPSIAPIGSGSAIVDTVGSGAVKDPGDAPFASEKWGTGENELGRLKAKESNPEAPMSFTIAPDGTVIVLDQVNGRLVKLGKDGKPIGTVPINVKGAQDVATTKDGSLLVLDRIADKTVSIMGPDGKVLGTLPVEGKGIQEGGAVTGMFVDGKDVYVEREHQQLVLVGDVFGNPASSRTEVPGRPTRDGSAWLNAWLESPPTASIYVAATRRSPEEHIFTREIRLPLSITNILLLDSDRAGVIYLAVMGSRTDGSADGDVVELVCLEPTHGAPIGEQTLPANTMAEETFRDFAVRDEGGVLYSYRTEAGVQMINADCRPHTP